MIVHLKIFPLVLLLLSSTTCEEATSTAKDDLLESESKDPAKVEIIKQIKRVNEDGSYTFGYEAEDGTFKIESRDVLGNIKGTFGFVDSDGEIKRVSYSSTNSTESAAISSAENNNNKERSSVIQQIPKLHNRTIISSTTRRPNIIYPSPTSAVIQTIPRRRISSSTSSTISSSSSSSSSNNTERPSYKNIVKSVDFDIATTARSSLTSTEPTLRASSTSQPRSTGHYIRSTIAPHGETHRFTEGQLIRPTPDSITSRPTESYPRRLIITRNPYLEEASSTIKPITEENYEDNARGNLLRRQLTQEKISSFDTRQHIINLQQSVGDDSTDVYSGSLTTGTPRPLFTTTDRPRIFATPTASTIKGITPAKYQNFYQKNLLRGPRPTTSNYIQETTTTDASNTDNYVTPSPLSVVQIPNSEDVPFFRRHPFHRGAVLIPVNNLHQNGRYILEEPNEDVSQQQFVAQYAIPNQQYLQETNQIEPVPYQIIQKRKPIPIVTMEDYPHLFMPARQTYPIAIPVAPINPVNSMDGQDDIDNIKPPVSTKDFQKLLNRLIMRQTQLQEISKLEQTKINAPVYYNPERYRYVQPTPVSVFVRARPEHRQNNGPVQFVPIPQTPRARPFIAIPQQSQQMQKIMENHQQFNSVEPYSNYVSQQDYRQGRRVARLLQPTLNSRSQDTSESNYLPADVREMLLLRMLQLAINPNLPLPPSEGETMASAIRETKNPKPVRNVEIIGEERDEDKPVTRSKRYRESDEYDYY